MGSKKKKQKRSAFGANVVGDVARRESKGSAYGYLNLPKGVKMFKEDNSQKRIKLDIIPYEVTIDNHPDANPDEPQTAHKNNLWYKKPIWVFRNIGPNNEAVISLKTIGKKCPILEYKKQQVEQGVDQDEQIPWPQERNLYRS